MTRRQLLEASLAAAALPLRAGAGPSFHFPTAPRERIAVASYPFREFLDLKHGSLTLLDFPRMVADRFGVHGIEPLDQHFPSTDSNYLDKLAKALASANSRVVNIPVGRLHASFYDADPAKRKIAVADARRWIDVAAALGAPSIRAHIRAAQGAQPDAARAADGLSALAVYGESRGIVVTLENDDPRSEQWEFIVQVIENAANPWLRALPDFCNSMLSGQGEAANASALKALFAHAYSICHVKDSEDDSGKHFAIDTAPLFAIAGAANFRGFYSIEWDASGDPYANTKRLVDLTLKALTGANA